MGKKVLLEGHFPFPLGNYLNVERQYPPHSADKAIGVPELFTDHSMVICTKQPLRFGGTSLQSMNKAENHFRENPLKRSLRAVPGCRCQKSTESLSKSERSYHELVPTRHKLRSTLFQEL